MRDLERATPTVTLTNPLQWYFRGPVTPTPVAQRLAVELSLPDFTTSKYESNPDLRIQGERSTSTPSHQSVPSYLYQTKYVGEGKNKL